MKIWQICMIIGVVLFGMMISGCQTEKKEETKTTPTTFFYTKNASEILNEENHEQQVATITLSEGNLLNSEIMLMISADGDKYYEITDKIQTPNNDPVTEWNPGEAIIITEAIAREIDTSLVDTNLDWVSQDFFVHVIYKPADKLIFSDHVTLERSSEVVDIIEHSYNGRPADHGTGITIKGYSTAIHHYPLFEITVEWEISSSPSGARSKDTNQTEGFYLHPEGASAVVSNGTNTQGADRVSTNTEITFHPDASTIYTGTYQLRLSVTYDGIAVSDTCIVMISM